MTTQDARIRLSVSGQAQVAQGVGQVETALHSMGRAGQMSAKQAAQAMRMLPAQFTDVATSLAGGQSPLLVLLQQGGQIRDQFGSVGAAVRGVGSAVAAMISPVTLGAAAVAAMGAAAYAGIRDNERLRDVITLTGNAAGLTSARMRDLAAAVEQGSEQTIGAARDIVAELAKTGQVGPAALQATALAVARVADVSGESADKVAADFAGMRDDVAKWAAEHNKVWNFLTVEQYRYIARLQEQGRAEDAQIEVAERVLEHYRQQRQELGALERAMEGAAKAASALWDSVKDLGRTDAVTRLKEAQENLRINEKSGEGFLVRMFFGTKEENQRAIAEARADIERQAKEADAAARAAAANRDAIAKAREAEQQRKREKEQAEQRARAASEQQAAAYTSLVVRLRESIAAQDVEIKQQTDLTAGQRVAIDVAQKLSAGTLVLTAARRGHVEQLLAELQVREQTAAAAARELKWIQESAQESAAATDREIARAASLRDQVLAQQQANDAIGLTTAAVTALEAARLRESAATKDALAATLESASPDIARAYRDQAQALRDLADAKAAGGRKTTAESALADLGLGAKDVRQALDLTSVRDAAAGLSNPLSQVVAQFQTMIDLQARFGEQADLIAKAKQGDAAQQARALKAEGKLASQIEAARLGGYASLAGAAKGFFSQNSKGYKALAAAEKAFRVMELASAAQSAAVKLGWISTEVGAKVAAETTKAAAVVAGQATETSAVTAGEAARNAAKVPGVFMAFMSALGPWGMAAAAVAIAAVLGGSFSRGGGSRVDAGNTGTGTVFGDKDAKSESISKSLELLAEVDTKTMRYSSQMAASLRNIENNIGGLTNLLIRSGSLEAAAAGVKTGTKSSVANAATSTVGMLALTGVVGTIADKLLGGFLSGLIGGIAGKLFNTKTTIKGQGIYGADQSLAAILAGGFDASYYVDVNKKKKAFGVTYSNKNKTKLTDADPELERQFTMIFEGFSDAVRAAAGPLGVALADVDRRLQNFTVSIGKINLKDLSGEEIQEKLSAVFGAAGDDIARAALAGLESYQKVGEGYLETVVRVAASTETVRETLRSLGGTVLAFGAAGTAVAMDLVDAFGDLEEFRSQTSAYLEAFYSDSERAAITTRQLSEALQRLGIDALPSTKAAWRDLVDAQDLTTESGREAYAALIGLSSVFADLVDLVDNVNSTLTDAVADARETLISAYEREADTLASTVDRFRDFGGSLRDFRDSLLIGNLSPLTPAQQYAQAKMEFRRLSDLAAQGDESAMAKLQTAAQTLLAQSQSYNAGSAAYLADFQAVQDALSDSAISALAAADVAQLQLDAIKGQLEVLGRIDDSAVTIADAMTGLRDAVAAAIAGGVRPGDLGPLPSFDVGTNYVPGDMVARIHRGERIIPAADNAQLMQRLSDPAANSAALVAEVRALRAEVQQLREQNNQGHAANAAATERTAQKVADGVSRATHAASLQARAAIR